MTNWTKARCDLDGCIEVALNPHGAVMIRTQHWRTPIIATSAEWDAFIAGVKRGDFDHLGPADQ